MNTLWEKSVLKGSVSMSARFRLHFPQKFKIMRLAFAFIRPACLVFLTVHLSHFHVDALPSLLQRWSYLQSAQMPMLNGPCAKRYFLDISKISAPPQSLG